MSSIWQWVGALLVGVALGWWLHPEAGLLPRPVKAEVPQPVVQPTLLSPKVAPLAVAPIMVAQSTLALSPPPLSPPKAPTPLFLTLLEKGQVDRAIAQIKGVPSLRQKRARKVMLHLATVLLQDHHADGAMALLTPYHQQWPNDVAASRLLARSMLDLARFEPAIALLGAALKQTAEPQLLHDLQHHLDAAVAAYDTLLRQQDHRNRLLALYRQLAASDGNNARYQIKQAELLIEMGQTTEASALLQPLLFGAPGIANAAHQLQLKIERQLAQSFTDTIALTRLNNHFVVPVQLAGRTLMLLLDTGASLTLVPKAVARSYPADASAASVTLATANGTITVPRLSVPQMQLGAQLLHHISLALTDNMGIQGADGLLGMDILKRFHFVIDQEHATLRLTPRTAGLSVR
ncbi:MAG: retroviral-like aspartic protease family protein [Mariprofundales bacterium]